MDANTPTEKKCVHKAKSHNITGQFVKANTEPTKRKSFNVNEAVRSLDVALGRLKKSKLVDGEYTPNTTHTSPVRRSFTSAHTFIESMTEPNYHGTDSTSLTSMNFSHYELMRNLSRTNSDGAFSCTTCRVLSATDIKSKTEHLERYFRSVDQWGRHCSDQFAIRTSTSNVQLNIDK